ncbi:transposase, partial [Turicibacter sanguinis]|uniref:transposase n=1 Tax=Turicibacter sanguinis TaxID=154288 RepID=UPI0011C79967
HLLETEHPMISPELQTSFQTFKTYTSYIYNTLTTPYTNGPIEGINNKINVIKRIAFGYRSFYHFKSRILMIQNLTKPKRKILVNQQHYLTKNQFNKLSHKKNVQQQS